MGSIYRSSTIPHKGYETREKVIKRINDHIDEDIYEHGMNPYSGYFGAKDSGITFSNKQVSSFEEAEELVENESGKWDPILVVHVTNDKETFWYYGGWCPS